MTPGFGRRTVIINNSGNTTNHNGNTSTQDTYTGTSAATKEYVAPKPLTPEQKINRAERLASEAREAKKGTAKILLIAIILLVMGLFVSVKTSNRVEFQKYNLSGTVDVGYATDEINGIFGVTKTQAACEDFYETIGVPLYFYTIESYSADDYVEYAAELYDNLFRDKNHVLLVAQERIK